MPVPSSNSHLKNTTGGAFSAQSQGGTVLGNTITGNAVTNALALKDNASNFTDGTLPKVLNDGLSGNQKALSGGTFAYSAAGNYVIAASSSTLSGVASNELLITSRGNGTRSIAQFEHDFGAGTASLVRKNRFARSGYLNNGNKLSSRRLFLNAAGTAGAAPTAMNSINNGYMLDPVAGATSYTYHSDSAANPTRAIPGELVMKVDFVTLSVASGGDFFNYKAITGV
jgi:hypothetical protein